MKHPSADSHPLAEISPADAAADPAVGTSLRNGSLQLLRSLGGGGMGRVYQAFDSRLSRSVAVKMLRPEQQNDEANIYFEREARAASKLWHPNIIQILDFGREPDGTRFLVMEFVKGKNLADIIEQFFPLPPERIIHILSQILAALEVAHQARIIHRDLKPENIMLQDIPGQPDFVKILDFGIAKNLGPEASIGPITQRGLLMGTPHFMAPEQVLGHDIDGRTDLYAVGAILYQVLTAHLPFEGKQVMHILARVVSEQPIPPSQRTPDIPIDPSLEAYALRALRKNMDARFQSAAEFREALQLRLQELKYPSPSQEFTVRAPTAPRKIAPSDLNSIREQSQNILSDSIFDLAASQINIEQSEVIYLLSVLEVRLGAPPSRDAYAHIDHIIRRYGGVCRQPSPGRVLAFFGYPRPIEDSPLASLQAAIALSRGSEALPDALNSRFAIAYGHVSITNNRLETAHGSPLDQTAAAVEKALPGEILANESLSQASSTVILRPSSRVTGFHRPTLPTAFDNAPLTHNPRVPLLGRASEQTKIQQFMLACFKGRASSLLILGGEGLGKTRLLSYAARFAESQRAVAIEVCAERFPHAVGALTLRRLLHAALNLIPSSNQVEGLELLKLPTVEYEALLHLLQDQPPQIDPRFWLPTLTAAFTALFRTVSSAQPLLITCDIGEHLDAVSAEVLVALCARLGPSPVALILGSRPLDQDPAQPPGYTGPSVLVAGLLGSVQDTLSLLPIPADILRPVVLDFLPPQAEIHCDHVLEVIDGRPDHLTWILESLQQDQPEPHVIAALTPTRALSARLRRLAHGARRLAAFAAALGASFPMQPLEGSVPERWQLRENLRVVGNAGLLTIRDDVSDMWLQFHPASLAASALETLPEETRNQIHLLIARHYQRTRGDAPSPDHDFQWARHLLAGGHAQNAVKMFALAADNALRLYGPLVAQPIVGPLLVALDRTYQPASLPYQRLILKVLTIYSRANMHRLVLDTAYARLSDEHQPPDAVRAERDLLRAQSFVALGDRKEGLAAFSQAIAVTPKDQPLLCAHLYLQRSLAMHAFSRAPEAVQDALMATQLLSQHQGPLPRQHNDLSWRPHLLVGLIQQQRQQHARAIAALTRALDGATSQNDEQGLALSALQLALSYVSLDRRDEALSALQSAAANASSCGDLLTHARALHETGILQCDMNRRQEALENFFASLSFACDLDWQEGIRLNRLWVKRLQSTTPSAN